MATHLTEIEAAGRTWRDALPLLRGRRITLAELELADAPALLAIATRREITRFSWPAPSSVAAVEHFIRRSREDRAAGRYLSYGVFLAERALLAGMFELRRLQPDFYRAEVGFLLAPEFWGQGLFYEAGRLVVAFAFETVGVHRLEARIAVDNDRSNAALRRLGAVNEGILHEAFLRDGQHVDQYLWAILKRPKHVRCPPGLPL